MPLMRVAAAVTGDDPDVSKAPEFSCSSARRPTVCSSSLCSMETFGTGLAGAKVTTRGGAGWLGCLGGLTKMGIASGPSSKSTMGMRAAVGRLQPAADLLPTGGLLFVHDHVPTAYRMCCESIREPMISYANLIMANEKRGCLLALAVRGCPTCHRGPPRSPH